MKSPERRTKKFIEPRIQKRFALVFLSMAGLATLVQAVVVSYLLMRVADGLPNDGIALKTELPEILASSLLVTMAVLAPLTVTVGFAATHRIVGPLYRFRVYLTQLTRGERPAACRIRKGDELQDFCELLNQATQPLRGEGTGSEASGEEAA